MEINKILFLTTTILVYTFLTIFVSKIITKKIKKEAIAEDNFNYYAIIFCGILVSASFFGKEMVTVIQDSYVILSKNQASRSEFLRIVSIFCTSGILISIISYFLAFVLLKVVFEKINIIEKYNSDQYGYFLLFATLIVMISFLIVPIYNQILLSLSPKLEISIYN